METNEFNVWTLVHSPITADPRDWKADAVLPTPTDKELANLPEAFDQWMYIGATYYQNGWGSCTALWTTHSMQIQNVKELQLENPDRLWEIVNDLKTWLNPIFLDRKSLWTKMGHNLANKEDSWDYAEKALQTAIDKGIDWVDIDWNNLVYYAKNYSYKTAGFTDLDIAYLKYYITKYPLVSVFLWNQNTWNEMSAWEVVTVLTPWQTTWWHCICNSWYDAYGPKRENSRTPNNANKKKCEFKMSWDNYKKAVQSWMINWRYRQLFDWKEAIVNLDKYKEDNNMTVLLQTLHDKYNTTSKVEVQKKISELWALIRKDYPNADKNVPH